MKGKTWFGTRGFEAWVPTPAINPDYSRSGFSSRADYVNGGAGVRDSKNAHNIYVLSWRPTKSREEMRLISDFADGVFDSQPGINLIYWIDPMARDQNVLNQAWSTPHLQAEDASPIVTAADGSGRPTASATPANPYRYPARAATFNQTSSSILLEQYVPIPPGHSAWVGVHGATSGRIRVQRVNGYSNVGSPVVPTLMGLTQDRVNTEFSSVDSSGILIQVVPVASPTTWTLYALCVQILPIGVTPTVGMWITGQGHSGCQFVGKPSMSPYSAAIGRASDGTTEGRVGGTARLEETGMFL